MNLVTRAALPPDGLKVDYNVITSDATTVAKQAKEGDALKFGKISFGTKSAQIETYGGYTTLSRQVIERATTPMLETALKALKIAYARSTELAVRADLYGLIDSESKANNKIAAGKTVDKLTVADWVSILVDASEIMDERDYGMSALGVSKEVFKALAALADPGDRFMDLSGKGANTLGSLEVTGVQGDLMHIPVRLLPSAPAGTASIINPEAVTAWEAGGPFQLTDTDPTKLTDNYSVYGYMAVGDTAPQAILPITMIAA